MARTLAEAHTWAQGLIEAVTGIVGADVTVTPSLPDGTVDRVREAQALMVHADAELRRGAEQIRDAARNVLRTGMSQQDAAIILGVSRQRVSQLLKVLNQLTVLGPRAPSPLGPTRVRDGVTTCFHVGFSRRNLHYMRRLAEAWPGPAFVPQAVAQMPWGHLRVLLDKIEEPAARDWYIRQCVAGSPRIARRQ